MFYIPGIIGTATKKEKPFFKEEGLQNNGLKMACPY